MTAAARACVLFVDDEPRVLTTMRMLFRAHYDLLFANSGAEALELLKTRPVDVIVSDQRMPGMTGVEVLRAARDLRPHAMRVLLTGYSDLKAILGSINDGEIFRFVNKPWSNEELTSTVAKAVAAAHVTRSVADRPEPVIVGASAGVLVLDDDPTVPDQIRAILGNGVPVHAAATHEEAVGVLERERIGVVISDTRVQDRPVIDMLGTLKLHHPELVSVILTQHADAGAAIGLINQGQIYRYVLKPIHDTQCKIALNSAIRHHHRLAQTPELRQRYEVQAPPPAQAAPPATARLLDRIRSLRSLVGRA